MAHRHRTSVSLLLTAVALLSSPVVRAAAADFEPGVGGFVGKGEVQAALRWGGAATESRLKGVSFSYESTDKYAYVCSWQKAEGMPEEREYSISINASTDVVSVLRTEEREDGHAVVTGFDLMGFQGSGTVSGKVPQVGDLCPGSDDPKSTISKVELVEAQDCLMMKFGSKKVPIWSFP